MLSEEYDYRLSFDLAAAWRPQQYQDLQAGHSTVADNPTAVDDAAPIATLIADLRKSSPLSTASEAMDMPERTLPNAHGEEEETRRTVKQPQSLSQSPGILSSFLRNSQNDSNPIYGLGNREFFTGSMYLILCL